MKYVASNFFLSQVCKLAVVSQVVLSLLSPDYSSDPIPPLPQAYFPTSFGCSNLFVFLTATALLAIK